MRQLIWSLRVALQKVVTALGGELTFPVLIGGRDYNLQADPRTPQTLSIHKYPPVREMFPPPRKQTPLP